MKTALLLPASAWRSARFRSGRMGRRARQAAGFFGGDHRRHAGPRRREVGGRSKWSRRRWPLARIGDQGWCFPPRRSRRARKLHRAAAARENGPDCPPSAGGRNERAGGLRSHGACGYDFPGPTHRLVRAGGVPRRHASRSTLPRFRTQVPARWAPKSVDRHGDRGDGARRRAVRWLGHCAQRTVPFRLTISRSARQPGSAGDGPPPPLTGNQRFLVIQGAK
jgi:hypothetical protein